jgi:hypothetical protein
MKTVILLCGKKSTGKDTAAKHIQDVCGPTATGDYAVGIKSFADPLKKFCIDVLGLQHNQCYGESAERNGFTDIAWKDISLKFSLPNADKWKDKGVWDAKLKARDVLQIVGTDVLRSFYENIWAKAATVATLKSNHPIVVFSDTRFPNEILEFEKLQETGQIKLVTIRITRPGLPYDSHPSELALDRWDEENRFMHVIRNDGTLKAFKGKITKTIKKYGLVPEAETPKPSKFTFGFDSIIKKESF